MDKDNAFYYNYCAFVVHRWGKTKHGNPHMVVTAVFYTQGW